MPTTLLISIEHDSLRSELVFMLSLVVTKDLLFDLVYLLMSVRILLAAFQTIDYTLICITACKDLLLLIH